MSYSTAKIIKTRYIYGQGILLTLIFNMEFGMLLRWYLVKFMAMAMDTTSGISSLAPSLKCSPLWLVIS